MTERCSPADELLRSLAFALKVSGSALTFRQLASLVVLDLGSRFGGFHSGTRAAKAQAIFAHTACDPSTGESPCSTHYNSTSRS